MDSNISLPDWLTDEKIKELKRDLAYAKPYSQSEVDALPLDGDRDWDRYDAYSAEKILTKYNLI